MELSINKLLDLNSGGGGDTCISGCLLWLDASDPTTVTDSGTQTWADKSALGNNATQATAASKPVYSSANKEFTVDAVDDVMSLPTIPVNQGLSTCFFVYNRTGASNDMIIANLAGGSNYIMDTATLFYYFATPITKVGSTSGARKLISVVSSAASIKLYINGVFDSSIAPLASNSQSYFDLLWEYINGNNKFDGKFSAAVIYNRPLTDAERALVEAKLNLDFSIY